MLSYQQGALISSAQNFTTSWVDLGDPKDTQELQTFGAWLDLDINDGANMRVRLLAKHPKNTSLEFVLPIKTVSASDVKVEDNYIEFNDDSDQQVLVAWTLDKIVPKVQVQIQAGTAGATAAQVDNAYYTAR